MISEVKVATYHIYYIFIYFFFILICMIIILHVSAPAEPVVAEDPCNPNPCGLFSNPPRNSGSRCDCSCLPGMLGSPPNCKPECQFNKDCPREKTCSNNKCVDPCPGLCGYNADCRVRMHVPVCICKPGYTGDPFTQCQRITSKGLLVLRFKIIFIN